MLQRKVRLPTDASIQSQPRRRFPRVVHIKADVFGTFKVSLSICLFDCIHASHEAVRQAETCELPVEADRSICELRVVLICNSSNEIAAKRDLMATVNPIDIL